MRWIHELYIDIRVGLSCDLHIDILLRDLLLMLLLVFVTSGCHNTTLYSILLSKLIVLWQPLITKTNDHTSGKSLSGISSGEFTRELDKESLLN